MDKKPEKPTIKTDPPHYKFDPNFESQIDEEIRKIQEYASKKPVKEINEDITFQGDFKKQKNKIVPNGKGILKSKEKSTKMIGSFKEGPLEGPGIIIYPDLSYLKGIFTNGITNLGIRNYFDLRYEGEIKDGQPSGSGIYQFREEGTIYVKEENGKLIAKGYQPDGRLWYKGGYVNGRCEGEGIFYFKNGEIYEGEFQEGKMNGIGILRDEFGDVKYHGEFQNDLPAQKVLLFKEPLFVSSLVISNIILYLRRAI